MIVWGTQNIKEHEFEQYRLMFNSLQEGVLVIDAATVTDEE